ISTRAIFLSNYDWPAGQPIRIRTQQENRPRIENVSSNLPDAPVVFDIVNKLLNSITIQLGFSDPGSTHFTGNLLCSGSCTPQSISVDTGFNASISGGGFSVVMPITTTGFGQYIESIPNQDFTVTVDDRYEFSDIEINMTLFSGSYLATLQNIFVDRETRTTSSNVPVVCKSTGTRFTFSMNPDVVDFGIVTAGQAETVSRNVSFNVTSGTSVPSGTIKFESASANGFDLPLGTGKLNIFNSIGTRLYFNTPYIISSRNEDFTAVLYPADVTNLGLSETSVTVVVTIY
ncbi:hypothetical protein IMB71_001890, partial [Salmonella enterica]|nr:hypothetical protein [Salmonella enterica]